MVSYPARELCQFWIFGCEFPASSARIAWHEVLQSVGLSVEVVVELEQAATMVADFARDANPLSAS